MKILLLNRSYFPHLGGIENSLFYLSREFNKMGHDVAILTQQPQIDIPQREEYAKIIRYPRRTYSKLLLPFLPSCELRTVTDWIRENQNRLICDLVVCRDPLLGLAYSRIYPNTPIVYIPAVIIKYYNKGIRKADSLRRFAIETLRFMQLKIEEKQQKKILCHAKKVLVFSRNVKNQIISGKLCDIKKVEVCPPGVADKFLSVRDGKKSVSAPHFVFVGRLVDEKNLMMLLEAFALLDTPDKHLTLVGDGDQRTQLENRADELGIGDAVTFAGATDRPQDFYPKASFFVIPSKYESFGQVIVEALCCGLPVIGFATIEGKTLTAVEELVCEGVTGFVCREFGKEALSECLKKAATVSQDGEKYAEMRRACIDFSDKNFTWKNISNNCF